MSEVTINAFIEGTSIKLDLSVYDENDNPVDADATPTIDIWDSEGTQTVTSGTANYDGTGLYSYYYAIPSTGPEGVWKATWSYAVGGNDYKEDTLFDVISSTYFLEELDIPIEAVRADLTFLSKDALPDATIHVQIVRAQEIIDHEKDTNASTSLVWHAKLALASYYSFLAYSTGIQRSRGMLPEHLMIHLEELKNTSNELRALIRKTSTSSKENVIVRTKGYIPYIYDTTDGYRTTKSLAEDWP